MDDGRFEELKAATEMMARHMRGEKVAGLRIYVAPKIDVCDPRGRGHEPSRARAADRRKSAHANRCHTDAIEDRADVVDECAEHVIQRKGLES